MKLFSFERRWMVSIFEAVVPSGATDAVSLGAADLPMGRYADELVRYAPPRVAFGYRAAAWLIVLFGPLLTGSPARFTKLDPARRAQVLERMERSTVYLVRELPTLYKMLSVLGYCGAPQVQQQLGITRIDDTPPEWMR